MNARPARRPAPAHRDLMDVAHDLGVARGRIAELEQYIEQQRQPPAQPKQGGGALSAVWTVAILVASVVVGLLIYERLPVGPMQTAPTLPTAAIAPRPTVEAPRQPPPVVQPPAPAAPAVQDAAPPAPAWEATSGGPALQAEADQQLAAPPAPPAPGEQGFAESFAPAPCSAFIGYLPGHPCHGRAGEQPLPQPGDAGFVESFQ